MKRLAASLCLLLVFTCMIAAQDQSPREAYYRFVEARDSLRGQFNISDAEQRKAFSEALKEHSAKLKVVAEAVDPAGLREDDLYYLGIIAGYSALPEKGIESYKLYLGKFPRGNFVPIVRKELLKRLAMADRIEEARELLPKIQAADLESYFECLSYIAWTESRLDNPEGALEVYKTILEETIRRSGHEPLPAYRLARLLPSMARLMQDMGKTGEALNLFKDAMSKLSAAPDIQARLQTVIAGMETVGAEAKPLQVERWLNSDGINLEDQRGKVVLMDFWSTWCGPCITAFPDLAEIRKEFKDKPFAMCGLTKYYGRYKTHRDLSPDEEIELIKSEFIPEHKTEWPLGFAADDSLFADYGITNLPTVVLIDKDGIIRYRIIGHEENFKEDMISKINELLAK